MKKLLAICFMLFFAPGAMTASIHFASYDEEEHSVHLRVSYCYVNEFGPGVELVDEYCQESYPETCFVSLLVHGESSDIEDLNTVCVAHWLTYDVPSDDPIQLVFRANDGSEGIVWIKGPPSEG